MDKSFLRSLIFRHLDGIVTAPVLSTLASKGILHYIVVNKKTNLSQLSEQFQTNEGYLNVALRVLASQNMLQYALNQSTNEVIIEVNKYSERAFSNLESYNDLFQFLKLEEVINRKDFSDDFCKKWVALFDKYEGFLLSANQEEFLEKPLHFQICKHIEGALISPLIVRLGMSGLFHKYFMEASFSAEQQTVGI